MLYDYQKKRLWDRETIYDYYLQGLLACMEIGDDGVQGGDYAYTLQGWIKGVNSNGLAAEKERSINKDVLVSSISSSFPLFQS